MAAIWKLFGALLEIGEGGETTQDPSNGEKPFVAHPYNGMLLSNKKETNYWHTGQHTCVSDSMLSEISQTQKVTYCMA